MEVYIGKKLAEEASLAHLRELGNVTCMLPPAGILFFGVTDTSKLPVVLTVVGSKDS